MQDAVKAAAEQWETFFNAGDAEGCASCYEKTATMTARPYGKFYGRKDIERFWTKLLSEGFRDVKYPDTVITALDNNTAIMSTDWTMNKATGVVSFGLWILQNDGEARLREEIFELNYCLKSELETNRHLTSDLNSAVDAWQPEAQIKKRGGLPAFG